MQWNIRAAPGVGRRREIVGVGFAGDLEDRQLYAGWEFGTRREPLRFGPAFDDALRDHIACLGFFRDIVEEVEHQQGLLQAFCGDRRQRCVIEQINQRLDVVTANHCAEQFRSFCFGDLRGYDIAMGDGSEERRLDLGGIIDARRRTRCVIESTRKALLRRLRAGSSATRRVHPFASHPAAGWNTQRSALGSNVGDRLQTRSKSSSSVPFSPLGQRRSSDIEKTFVRFARQFAARGMSTLQQIPVVAIRGAVMQAAVQLYRSPTHPAPLTIASFASTSSE